MRTFQVTINADNAAFDDEPSDEICRILRKLVEDVNQLSLRKDESFNLRDINGNNVGSAEWVIRS